ncbi:MAG TPA: helix-turn-helix domain-containing protein [Micromonosporaceae bacterium]|nr:helix-turn-helix domain-containing protein [Micromonosporaceae bacterium]
MDALRVVPRLAPGICPVTDTFAFIGSKWTPLVLVQLHFGPRRFNELYQDLPGISPKTLADRLQAMEEQGLVTRTVHPDKPPRVEYALTDRGAELGGLVHAIADWAGATPLAAAR